MGAAFASHFRDLPEMISDQPTKSGLTPTPQSDLFRQEALDYHIRGKGDYGSVLRIVPTWTRWAYWLLGAILIVGLLFICLSDVNEYATGYALVRDAGRTEIAALSSVRVASVEVKQGQQVAANELLVRFHDADDEAELNRIKQQIGLLTSGTGQTGGTGRQFLATLVAQKEFIEKRQETNAIRAPHAGIVSDVRVRPGQYLSEGDSILSLVDAEKRLSIVALIPGRYRPLLKPGMKLRLHLTGFRALTQELTIDSVADTVSGPEEARRLLKVGGGDGGIDVFGPVVIVGASLPSRNFRSDGRLYDYYDGMSGTAEILVRSEKLLYALVPLKDTQ